MTTRTGPTFHVAGAARSGTTGLVEGLRAHPQVFVTHPKEPHFFAFHDQVIDFQGPGDAHTINKVAVTDTARYLALFADGGECLARGDGSVSTLYYHDRALPLALEMYPDLRFVILLREPVARAFSSHQYMRARGFEPHENFLEAVADEERRIAENWHHLWHYTSMSRYADAVAHFQDMLPATQLGIWFYDDLDRDYEGTIKEVLRFLDVPSIQGEGEGIPRVNISGQPRYQQIQKALWWATRHEYLRRAVKRFTTYRFRERIRSRTLQRGEVPPQVVTALTPLFEDDLRRLGQILPRDLARPVWLQD